MFAIRSAIRLAISGRHSLKELRKRRPNARRPVLESLEQRALMDASGFADEMPPEISESFLQPNSILMLADPNEPSLNFSGTGDIDIPQNPGSSEESGDDNLDVNASGAVNLLDLIAMARHLHDVHAKKEAGVLDAAELYDEAVDVNRDALNTVADLLPIVHRLRDDLHAGKSIVPELTVSFFDDESDRERLEKILDS